MKARFIYYAWDDVKNLIKQSHIKFFDGNMDAACEKALQQIEDRDYAAKLKDDGMRNIIKYGIACYKNNCKVMLG